MRETWASYLASLRKRGVPPETLDDLWRRVMGDGLEHEPFSPRLLLKWGYGHLLPPGPALLLEAAEGRGLTASAIAKRLGVSPTLVSWWFRGRHKPKRKYLRPLSELLGIPLEALREHFPDEGQEVALDKRYLSDDSLPLPSRFYRRVGLMRAKAQHLRLYPTFSWGDALWYVHYLQAELFFQTLWPPRKLLLLRAEDLSLEGEAPVFRPLGRPLDPLLAPALVLYHEVVRGHFPEGEFRDGRFFPERFDRKTSFFHLRDTLYPFAPGDLKRFVMEEARRVLGPWGVRSVQERAAPRLYEAWSAYIAQSVERANAMPLPPSPPAE